MDESNFANIRRESFMANGTYLSDRRLYLYRMFDPERGNSAIVPDPYYEENAAFEEVYQIVRRCGIAFLDFLIEKHNLMAEANN